MKLTFNQIKKLQKEYGYTELQDRINSGLAWRLEGSYGRAAMQSLENGMCMLPLVSRTDYYGNLLPSRDMLKKGTKGTFQNCQTFWTKVNEGEIFLEYPEDDSDDE